VQPILAFSDEGAFVSDNMPDHIRFFLDGYTDEIQYTIDNQQVSNTEIQRQWDALISESHVLPKDGNVVVGPLLGNNQWNQTKYYNNLCPADATGNVAYGGHAAVGCGALVMGQVMRYWRYPATGTGSHSYNSSNYGTLSANFGATTYHYESMPYRLIVSNHPDSCVDAIATLLYHCGVAVNMNYGPSASVANSNKIVAALSTYFRYPATVQYIERGSLPSSRWLNYLKGELDEGAPFMYGGSGSYGGHVWTCDGYRDDNYFHFNWGWGGQQNGYFALTNCSSYGFNSNHAIIIGIRGPELPENIEELNSQNINLYPNPTNDILNITSSETISEIEIVNVMGQVVKRIEVNADNAACNVEDLTRGVYVVRISTEGKVISQGKFVKE
ncbi:MAG: C10 family peptidase, partial [Bacteroidales bacterium]|nr:C10 family peptidase [Bacteroidales bacterium]